jgi:hypothetical protein
MGYRLDGAAMDRYLREAHSNQHNEHAQSEDRSDAPQQDPLPNVPARHPNTSVSRDCRPSVLLARFKWNNSVHFLLRSAHLVSHFKLQ